jgi:hypothetical protein
MSDNTTEIGGSTFALWRSRLNARVANFFQKRSERLHRAGRKTVISNPSCKFINHCTIIFNFKVDNNIKYQLVHEGKFTDKFKNWNKQIEEHNQKLKEYEEALVEWESKKPDERNAAPVKPIMDPYPLNNDMMFKTIISMKDKWYKKDGQ